MDLKSLKECTIPFDQFPLHWRFDDESYTKLNQIKPIVPKAAKFLWQYSSEITKNLTLRQNFNRFREISVEDETIKKWLFHTGLAFQQDVYIVWQTDTAIITKWKIFVKFFNAFYYFPDEISIFDSNLNWGLVIHDGKVIFGSNTYD